MANSPGCRQLTRRAAGLGVLSDVFIHLLPELKASIFAKHLEQTAQRGVGRARGGWAGNDDLALIDWIE